MTRAPLELKMLRDDFARLYSAEALAFIVSGYDGSGNFGDVIIAEEDVAAVSGSGNILPVLVVDPRNLERIEACRSSSPALRDALVLFAGAPGSVTPGADRLLSLEVPPAAPTALLMAGGGYVNERWGPVHLEMLEAVRTWLSAGSHPSSIQAPLLFGLQVAPAAFEGALGDHFAELVARSSGVGVRDPGSLRRVQAALPQFAEKAFLSGDDAVFALLAPDPASPATPAISIHFSQKLHAAGSADLIIEALKLTPCVPPRINLVAGHEDLYVSEAEQQNEAAFRLKEAGFEVERLAGLVNTGDVLTRIAAGSVTISCSYHIALASLVNGVPAILLADDPHYFEKHAGLAELFGLSDDFVVDVRRTTPAQLSSLLSRALSEPVRANLAAPIQRGALHLASARAQTVQRLQSTLRGLIAGAGERDLADATAELMRTTSRLAELRRANNAMVADAQRIIENEHGRGRRIAQLAEERADHLARELEAARQALASETLRVEALAEALELSRQHIRNLEATLDTKSMRIAGLSARAAGKLRRRRDAP